MTQPALPDAIPTAPPPRRAVEKGLKVKVKPAKRRRCASGQSASIRNALPAAKSKLCCQFRSAVLALWLAFVTSFGIANGQTATWTPAELPRSELPSERTYDYEFSDLEIASIEKWLDWFSVELPIALDGEVSGWLWVQRSEKGWLNLADYRVEGELRSPLLNVESWNISDATVRLGYWKGRWRLGQLAGDITSEDGKQPVGRVAVEANIPAKQPRILSAEIKAIGIQLAPVLRALDVDVGITHAPAKALLSAKAPLQSVGDLTTWSATGRVEFSELAIGPVKGSAATDFVMAKGRWRTEREAFLLGGSELDLSADGELSGECPFGVQLASSVINLNRLLVGAVEKSAAIIGLQGDLRVSGGLSGNVASGLERIELGAASELVQYAEASLRELNVSVHTLEKIGGKLPVEIAFSAREDITSGRVSGELLWDSIGQLGSAMPVVATADLSELDIGGLSYLAGVDVAGTISGDVRLGQQTIGESSDWQSEVRLVAKQLSIADQRLGDLQVSASKKAGASTVDTEVSSLSESLLATCAIHLKLATPESKLRVASYEASGKLQDYRVVLKAITNNLSIPMDASGRFSVRGSPGNWFESGEAQLSSVRASVGPRVVELYDVQVTLASDEIRVERFLVRDGVGRILGSLLLRRDGQQNHLVNLRVADVDVAPYWKSLASEKTPSVAGRVGVDLKLHKPARDADWTLGWNGTCVGELNAVSIRGVPAGQLVLKGSVKGDRLDLAVDGEILGGKCTAELAASKQSELQEPAGPGWGVDACDVALDGCELDRLMACVFGIRDGIRYDGRANATLVRRREANSAADWRVTCEIPNFGFGRRSLARNLALAVQLRGGRLTIERMSGGFAGGRLAATGQLLIGQAGGSLAGSLRFTAQQLQVPALVALVAPQLSDNFSGEVSYRGTASVSAEPKLYGDCRVRDASVYGVPIQDLRTRLRVVSSARRGGIQVSGLDMHGDVLGGRVSGGFELRGGSRWELTSSTKLAGGHLNQLSEALGFGHIVGSGRFTASAAIRSKDVFSLNSFAGPMRLDFEGGDARSVPILSDLGRLVPLANMATAEIKGGTLRAQLGQGIVRIQTVFLESNAFWLLGEGSASLLSQRLDMDAILQTGSGFDQELAQTTLQSVAELAIPQLAVANQINDLLRNRTLFFHIGGTSRRPVISPKAAQTVAKAFIQNLQRQVLVLPKLPDTANN